MLNDTQNLVTFPYIGRIVPEIGNENIRERFVYSYRLIYKIEEIEILIVAVIPSPDGEGFGASR
jgi:toxin ParE1/3/4